MSGVPRAEDPLADIFALIRAVTGTDFSQYRRGAMMRRVTHRMVFHKANSLVQYIEILKSTAGEALALHEELLALGSSFFRDPEVFLQLQETVLPALLRQRPPDEPIRIWVPGCSRGEEAYSIAICVLEAMQTVGRPVRAQIFGTDASEQAIAQARTGCYGKSLARSVSDDRLQRFFSAINGAFRIHEGVRNLCMFNRHNVASDPPFSELDMISCRNVLADMETPLQEKILLRFRYALKPNGILVLGPSEEIGRYDDLLECVDKRYRIFRAAGTLDTRRFLALDRMGTKTGRGFHPSPLTGGLELQRSIERILASEYAPPGVMVNDALEVVQYRGDTTPFLMPATGPASHSLVRMAREGLRPVLVSAIQEARICRRPVRRSLVHHRRRDGARESALRVLPMKIAPAADGFLILFEQPRPDGAAAEEEPRNGHPPAAEVPPTELRNRLDLTEEWLGSVIADREAAHWQLHALNDELLASNEQLQSVNEELESAKQELQSANQELTTLLREMQCQNEQLAARNNELEDVLNGANIPMLILGPDLTLQRFTRQAAGLFQISEADVGKPLPRLDARLNMPGVAEMLLGVIEQGDARESEFQDAHGHWQKVTIQPYRTGGARHGAIMAIIDIDLVKRTAIRYQQLFERTFQAPQDGMLLVDAAGGQILKANQRMMEMLGAAEGDIDGREIWTIPALQPLVEGPAELKRFAEAPYWRYADRWLTSPSGARIKVDVISIVHALAERDTIQFAFHEAAMPERLPEELSRREIQVLELLAAGHSTKQAAAMLGIAFKTAEGHRSAIMAKLGVHDTASMVRYAVRAGFVKP
ncbi:MAG TPA: CheR family methyltransferase [Bryobacteraceae bacterium]|nr:CheR family methyltransferase [Bryobacteraceae bacterium]